MGRRKWRWLAVRAFVDAYANQVRGNFLIHQLHSLDSEFSLSSECRIAPNSFLDALIEKR